MNNKKRIVNLKYFREMLHICPRIPNHTFDELPFKEEILAFLRNLGHSGEIKKITVVNINKLHQQWRSFAVVINKCLSGKSTGTRLSTLAKGKQPAKSSKAKGLSVLSKVALTEAKHMKLATKKSLQQTHISQASGSGADERTDNDGDDFVHPKFSTHDEEAKDEESFDPIVQKPSHVENSNDEGNDDESHGMNVGGHEGPDAKDDDEELYGDVNINLKEFVYVILIFSNMLNPSPDAGIDSLFESTPWVCVLVTTIVVPLLVIAPNLPPSFIPIISQLKAEVLTRASNSSMTSYVVAAGLSELELKKILIENMESNTSIHRSDEQMNLYKALVDAYECDKIILDTYEDTVTLKRRRDDEDKEPSTGLDRGSKSHQKTASESAPAEEPMHITQDLEEPAHQEFEIGATDDQPITKASQHPESDLAKQADSRTSFNELMDTPVDFLAFMMNRLKVDTLTPELLASLTYELVKGSCKSLVELEFFLEEVYKATTDQLDWNNPEGHQYPHNLLKHLPLIPNSRGHRVIPFDHFINNDLEYLSGGASSRKYTTSVTKTKATDYGHIKWIEDLIPRVESYQKKLNLTNPDTYRSDLKRKEAYTAYSNPRGFIYQNKDKQNRLMRNDELHKFSDDTLNDVQTALDDRLKEIRMRYLPQTIWRRSDKKRATAMIQAIDK
nr:hypothetical protein [Tanacetum cinerariifolium]